jgi:hypothetical protein
MISKETDRARQSAGETKQRADQEFIAAAEAAQLADKAAFARFAARLSDRRAEPLKKAGEPAS